MALVGSEGIVILAIIDAVLVAMFFLFRVLPWSQPGPWRVIWITAALSAALFSLGEASAMIEGGNAVSFEVQGPLFGAILAMTTCFILVYMHGARIGERALALAFIDDLTQLPNSRAFNVRLAARLRGPDAFSFAYIHLDGLGTVNDILGSHHGDALLKGFADLLRQHAEGDDVVARLGGDQFALLLIGSEARAGEVTRRIQTSFHDLVFREFAGITVVAAIGVVSRTQASDPGRLIRLAYRAMEDARRGGADDIATKR